MKPNLDPHEQIKQQNAEALKRKEKEDKFTNILIILLFPIFFIMFLIIGLGTKKEE